jgi:ribosomal protein S18 acetylase RimI-like enzyme
METPTVCILPLREEDIPDLVRLARDIWYRHYPGIIPVEQIEYMLAQRYGPALIRAQIAGGEAWWDKLLLDGRLIGFCACERGKAPDELKIDKVYVHYDLRGRGYGSLLIEHVQRRARTLGCRRLFLQVNKNNRSAIEAYLKNGFSVAESATFDIGGGFVMDDYVMVKEIRARGEEQR